MISSPNRSSRGGKAVRLVVIHTAEGARTVASLGSYFANPAAQASSHVGIDDQGVEQYVPYSEAAWTIRSANPISENAELCGFAAWSRAQWLNEHRRMLELAAGWIRERCTARGIPIRKLSATQVAAGQAGVCGHIDWTIGTGDGTHTDPGPGFPWDVVIALANGSTSTDGGFLMALSDDEQRTILEAAQSSLFGKAGVREAGAGALVIADISDRVAKLNQALAGVADAILDTPIPRQGEVPPWVADPGQQTTTTLRNEVAWMTALNWLTIQKPLVALHDQVAAAGTPAVDTAALAQQVAAAVTAAGIAGPVADELAARLGRAS